MINFLKNFFREKRNIGIFQSVVLIVFLFFFLFILFLVFSKSKKYYEKNKLIPIDNNNEINKK